MNFDGNNVSLPRKPLNNDIAAKTDTISVPFYSGQQPVALLYLMTTYT